MPGSGDQLNFAALDLDGPSVNSEHAPSVPLRPQAARRQAGKAAFAAFLQGEDVQKLVKSKTVPSSTKSVLGEESEDIASLAGPQKKVKIIKNPREYQIELFERAKKQNTIAVLGTGSGKTLIAVLLLRWVIDQELERQVAGHEARVSFFVVASVNLVYQQHSVIETNLDHPVARFCGADGVDSWNQQAWDDVFTKNKIIVCTADILLHCLSRSYVSIRRINLLILDEAHHAKKSHPYARIIKDFYLCEPDVAARPRIFSMTASPVDGKSDFPKAAAELEALLHSRIATATDMSVSELSFKAKENILFYDRPTTTDCSMTELWKRLHACFGDFSLFQKNFDRSKDVKTNVGRWCADQYLLDVFSETRQTTLELEVNKQHRKSFRRGDLATLNAGMAAVHNAIAIAKECQQDWVSKTITQEDLTSKTLQLYNFLTNSFLKKPDQRCIVFVQQRFAARLLSELLSKIKSTHMRCDYLLGSNNTRKGEAAFTFPMQVKTLLKFRKGIVNCLFATSVAEEGLDVPECNLVVRFDLCDTMIQYVQSRGRARKQDSEFVHLLEKGNSVQAQLFRQILAQEKVLSDFCTSLPADRHLTGNQDLVEKLLEKEKTLRVYTEPSTGAKLTYGNALTCLAHFVSAIPTEGVELQHPTYQVLPYDSRFIAEVILPSNSPVVAAVGLVRPKITLAKRSAAFQACLELRKKGFLTEYLMPIYEKRLPQMRNALLAVNNKITQYDMRVKPEVWNLRGSIPTELWLTVFEFCGHAPRQLRPLTMLTRTCMPDFPSFPIYLSSGNEVLINAHSPREAIPLDSAKLHKLTVFTLRVFQDVFSKTYEEQPDDVSYWLAPARSWDSHGDLDRHTAIDWELLDIVEQNNGYKWSQEMSNDLLVDKFLVDPFDGGKKFYSIGIDPDKKQTDPVPADAVKSKHMGSILDYSISLWKTAREKATWADNQPVIIAEFIPARRNFLAPMDVKEQNPKTRAYLCPEPLRISALPVGIVASAFIWPAIIHRLESHLIALEACAKIDIDCNLPLSLAAITKDSDNSDEHDNPNRVNFQHGMGENYERLEFIGDTFLKTATSMSVFTRYPTENEFEYHVRRMTMLCNKNLYDTAVEIRLYEYIRSIAFSRRLWYPEGLKLLAGTGVKNNEPKVMFHKVERAPLGEKTIADVCEALIGAAFVTHNKQDQWHAEDWRNAIKAVTALVRSEDHQMKDWNDYITSYAIPEYQTQPPTAAQIDLAQKIESKHNYHFNYPPLLYSAFMHPSVGMLRDHVPDYQRLEFLGDSLLDLACVSYLFYKYPDKDPHWLTEHKMAMVSNRFLGALCVNLGFHRHLRHHHADLAQQIQAYAVELAEAQTQASTKPGNNVIDYWTRITAPPKCLPDIIEAYIGALFIDSNFNYAVVQHFFTTQIQPYFNDMAVYDTFAGNHPVTRLNHLLQREFGCTDFDVLATDTQPPVAEQDTPLPNDHTSVVAAVLVHAQVVGFATGKSERYAKLRASAKAVEKLSQAGSKEDFRRVFGCTCAGAGGGEMEIDKAGDGDGRAEVDDDDDDDESDG